MSRDRTREFFRAGTFVLIGGALVFDYGFNVTSASDSLVWHPSDHDLMPSEKPSGETGS